MYVLLFVEWCMFIDWCMFLIICYMCESIEADCVVEDLNSFEEESQDDFEQGKWILSLHFCLYPSNAYNNVYFSLICII
jgi:hypothetical protein